MKETLYNNKNKYYRQFADLSGKILYIEEITQDEFYLVYNN